MKRQELTVDALGGVRVTITALLGTSYARLGDVLAFREGTIVPLDAKSDAPVSLLVNGDPVARGEIVVLEDGSLAIELGEIIAAADAAPNA